MWNYTQHFVPDVSPASNNASSQAFYGTGPFSEPETQNIKWIYDIFPNIRWYIDVHSAAGTLLYSWGDDVDQSHDPKQNLFNTEYDGMRGNVSDEVYKEYICQEDWDNIRLQANRTTAAMNATAGRAYVPQQAVGVCYKIFLDEIKANENKSYTQPAARVMTGVSRDGTRTKA
jgi:murein tripeptide amidase MpaA